MVWGGWVNLLIFHTYFFCVFGLGWVGKFYRTAVRPVILYGTECWAVKSQHETKVGVAEMRMLRWMCGKTRQDKIRNGAIRERVGVAPIVEKMVENRLRWFGQSRRTFDIPLRH